MAENQTNPYTWRRRRRFMYAVAAFCMLSIGYCLYEDLQSRVAETAVMFSYLTLMGCVGSYVFGAAWQDVSHMKTVGNLGMTGKDQ